MLNKKGLGKPEHWVIPIVFGILMVAGLVVMVFLSSIHGGLIDDAVEDLSLSDQNVEGIDGQFLEVELMNVLKTKIKEDYTFGEMLTYVPEESSKLDSIFDRSSLNGVYYCNTALEASFVTLLEDVLGSDWMISVFDKDNERLFFCTPITFDYADPVIAKATIPSRDQSGDLTVYLEVWE
jgi:hypothetical protein